MKKKSKQQTKPSQDVHFSPNLDAAMAAWETALQAFENEAAMEQQDGYVAATDSLGHAIAAFQSASPALAEQLGNWFMTHQDVWSSEESDGACGHGRC